MWGATAAVKALIATDEFQSTLPVWGATTWRTLPAPSAVRFQSTLPVWGATAPFSGIKPCSLFQSTLPVWGATHLLGRHAVRIGISIHAPRVGSDHGYSPFRILPDNFNPRSPCGERRTEGTPEHPCDPFQSTLPVWGATGPVAGHTPSTSYFNPRSPCGERPVLFRSAKKDDRISIHAPRVGSDVIVKRSEIPRSIFQSTLPVWGATSAFPVLCFPPAYFNPRSPCGERLVPLTAVCGCTNFNPRSPCGERHEAVWKPDLPLYKFQSTLPVWGATAGVPALQKR